MASACGTCCSVMILSMAVVLMIIDFAQFSALSSLNDQIDSLNQGRVTCSYACGVYYEQYNSQCCLFYNYNICQDKSICIQPMIRDSITERDNIIERIWIFSVLSIVMIIFFCAIKNKKCCRSPPRPNPSQNSLQEQLNANINRSEQQVRNKKQKKKRIEENYESFAYQDQENHCCICLEEFKQEKAILLKCGHIFHSLCIRDWAVKQENCPVCRSSQ